MDITGKTKLTALIGTPVAHSISPQMHNEAFHRLGLDYVYTAFDVTPEDLGAAAEGLKAIHIAGFNVTMPHKQAILAYADELTPAAEIAQAANTIINRDGKWLAHTTDGIGFMDSLRDAGEDITGQKMTILGCGGAATAICAQAALDGVAAIDIFEQPAFFAHAEAFAERIRSHSACQVRICDITDLALLRESIASSAILTNATSVGMAPNVDACLIPDATFLRPGLIVFDIIYEPKQTKLFQMAESAGCRTYNGMYMLLFQGAASFECWTGEKMPVEIIREKYFNRENCK